MFSTTPYNNRESKPSKRNRIVTPTYRNRTGTEFDHAKITESSRSRIGKNCPSWPPYLRVISAQNCSRLHAQIRGRESGCGRLRAPIMPLDANVRQIQANRRTACTETIVTELLYRQARARLISLAIAAGMLLERPLKSGGEQPSRAVDGGPPTPWQMTEQST